MVPNKKSHGLTNPPSSISVVKKLNVSKKRKNNIAMVVNMEIDAINLSMFIAIFSLKRRDFVNSV